MKTDKSNKFRYQRIAFQVDIARQMEKPETLKKIIDYGASLGYNELFLYGEGSLEYKSHPECSTPWALKQSDFTRLAKYAKKLGMDLIPVIPVLGHADYALKNTSLVQLREVKNLEKAVFKCDMEQFCTSNPATYQVLEDLIQEWAKITEADYIHIGGDESWNFATCPECRKRAKKYGRGKMLAEYFNRVNAIVRKYGKATMIWHDMLFYYKDAIEELDRNILICDWHYKPVERHPGISIYNWEKTDFIEAYKKHGFKYYICPKSKFNYPVESNNIKTFIEYTEKHRPVGFFNTVWVMQHMPYASCFPSLAYGAACCRKENLPVAGEFLREFANDNFEKDADAMPALTDLFSETAELPIYTKINEIINYHDTSPCEYLSSRLDNALELLNSLKPSGIAGKMYREAIELIFHRNSITSGLSWRINEIARIFLPNRRADKKNITKLLSQIKHILGKLPGQVRMEQKIWNKYRPEKQINPAAEKLNSLQQNVSHFTKEVNELFLGKIKAEKVFPTLLEISFVNNDCSWQYLSIFSSTDGKKYHKIGSYPQCGPFGRYIRTFPLPHKAKYIRLELTGFGQLLLHYLRIASPAFNATPVSIIRTAGNVSTPEHLLHDDFRPAIIGSLSSKQYFSEGKEQPLSMIEIKLTV